MRGEIKNFLILIIVGQG